MDKKYIFSLLIIILLVLFLRLYQVTEIPPSLNWDEISIGYNAYSILKTGKDEWNQPFPVHFKAYGEYKLPGQIYASIPGIYLLGLNELGIRITPVIYGTLTVLIMFFLGRVLFASSMVGLASAFLLAISPWHIQLTRASFESSFATFWIVLGIWLLIKGFKNPKWLVVSMVPFALSVFTYNSARIFTPLFLLSLLLIYRKKFIQFKKAAIISILIFLCLLIPLIPFLLKGEASARYKLVSITDDPGLVLRINEKRGSSSLPGFLPRLVHNKLTYVTFYATSSYLAHFTPQFLFLAGAPHKQHHVQNMGELYLFQAPFLLLGLYALFKSKNQFRWLLIIWVMLAYIPVATTNDSIPNALRTLIAAPFYQLVSALGFIFVLPWFKRFSPLLKIVSIVILVLVISSSVAYYLYQYFRVYPVTYSRDWQYGYKQAVDYIKNHKDEYDEIVFTRHYGEPHMFTLFYLNYDPAKYQNNPNLVRYETNDWVWVLRFDKFYFPDLGDKGTQQKDILEKYKDKQILFIGKEGDFPYGGRKLGEINFLNGKPAFIIMDNK